VADRFEHGHHRNRSVSDPQRDYRSMTASASACPVVAETVNQPN
jgi:hypothetical protein